MPQPVLAAQPDGPPKPDGRTKHANKLDIRKVIKLKDVNGLSIAEISRQLGYSEPYIHKVYKDFRKLMPSAEVSETYDTNRASLLSGMEYKLLENLAKEEKLSKASLNNVAYAFNQIHTARRLEEGKATGGVTVNIEIAYQQATDQAKEMRLQHAGEGRASEVVIKATEGEHSPGRGDDT